MARFKRKLCWRACGAALLLALPAAGSGGAAAQTPPEGSLLSPRTLSAAPTRPAPPAAETKTTDSDLLLSPATDFDGRGTRFQRSPAAARKKAGLPLGDAAAAPATFGNPAGFGAATTGYDSRNRARKSVVRKGGRIVRPEEGDEIAPPRKASAALPAAPAPLSLAPPPRSPQFMRLRTLPPQPAVPTVGAPLPEGTASRVLVPPPNAAATAPVLLRRSTIEDDPFVQTGLRAGAFTLRPALELSTGYDTNPARVTPAVGSVVGVISPELLVDSNWEKHALSAAIRGSYTYYPSKFAQEIDCNCIGVTPPTTPVRMSRPSLDARINGRADLGLDTAVNGQLRAVVGTDNPGSPNIQFGLARLPIYLDKGLSLGVTQRYNRFEASVTGNLDRYDYSDSELVNGTFTTNADRNYLSREVVLRGAYEVTPGFKPFVEGSFDTRHYDLDLDRSGYDRQSTGNTIKLGSTFELTRLLTGSVAVGRIARNYVDGRLPNLSGLLVDASLIWSVTPLTTVIGTAKTTVQETITPGVSGAFTRDFGLEVDHAFRRWLIGTVKLGYGESDYAGSARNDRRYSLSGAVTYKLNRAWQMKGELRQDWLTSTVPGVDYTASAAMVGLRWQP